MSGVRFNPKSEVHYTYAPRDMKEGEREGEGEGEGEYYYNRNVGRNDTYDGKIARRNLKIAHTNYGRTGDAIYFKGKMPDTGETIVNSMHNSGKNRTLITPIYGDESLPIIDPRYPLYPSCPPYESVYNKSKDPRYGGKRKSKKKQNKKSKKKQNKKSKKRLTYRRRRKSRK